MNSISFKYKILIPALFCFFLTNFTLAQESKQDTISIVKKHQTNAGEALKNQDFETAIVNLNKANKLLSSTTDIRLKSEILLSVSELNYHLHNFEKAATEANNAITLLTKNGNQEKLAIAYNLYGLILTSAGDYQEAERYLKEADKYFTEKSDEKNQANVVLGMGILELKKKNYKVAVNYFDAAIPLFQNYKLPYPEAMAYLHKAEALLYLKQEEVNYNTLEQTKFTLDKAIALSAANNYSKIKIDSYKIASYLALKQNDFLLAERNLEIYESSNDSIYQVYLKAISKGVDAESNVGNLTEIITAQKDDLDKKQKSINFGKMTTGLSIALIVILSLLTLSLYKNNNLRAKANELLQDKNNELLLAKEKAEKASLAKAQFLSTITHELRTPLYAVTGLTHLLLEEDPKPHQKEHLNSLKFSGEYLLSLINNILDLNKLEANKVEIEKTTFSLKKRINDVLIALKKSADDRKNNLHLEYDENIPEKLVGDPLKLSQVLINLIGNSVKFTQNGDVWVRIGKIDQKGTKVSLHFEIEDNGVGISKKKQKSIFETFSQASLQINRKFGGTGLGLSIVKNLLELMGSKIHLESQLGKGSKFWFNINFDISEEVREDLNPKNIIYDVDYLALENRKVLVVEDNKINQMITKKILEKNKMNCQVADNGMDAIELIKENDFDVILMDIHMPGISGIEATQKIREFDKHLPIIALTAVTIDENLDDFYRAGFNEIIPKPFKTEEFFEKIYRTLEGRKSPVGS
ncbi:MAG: response regulator [Altibacter sp.]|uniref:response regulator n=1 Tax=Altibacter sp. TaxID=2024823 RepID=UPI001D4A226C|nr:response regulator [Altibacter sp.]MBZ0328123.1 response regulator [Altibacter sp.]